MTTYKISRSLLVRLLRCATSLAGDPLKIGYGVLPVLVQVTPDGLLVMATDRFVTGRVVLPWYDGGPRRSGPTVGLDLSPLRRFLRAIQPGKVIDIRLSAKGLQVGDLLIPAATMGVRWAKIWDLVPVELSPAAGESIDPRLLVKVAGWADAAGNDDFDLEGIGPAEGRNCPMWVFGDGQSLRVIAVGRQRVSKRVES